MTVGVSVKRKEDARLLVGAGRYLDDLTAPGLLHLAGIGIGVLTCWPSGSVAIRIGGCAVAVAGCYFVYGYAGA